MNISLIGTGRIGYSLELDELRYKPCTHLGAITRLMKKYKQLKIQHLCDIDNNKLMEAGRYLDSQNKNSAPGYTTDFNQVVDSKPDILVIAASTSVHYPILKKAIQGGVNRIVVEKPVTMDTGQAKSLISLVRKNGTRIWVNYERRYHPKYARLKELVDSSSKLGKVKYYRGWFASPNTRLRRDMLRNEGVLLHDTTHLLDLVQFLFGSVKNYKSQTNERDNNPGSHLLFLKHRSGIDGQILTTLGSRFFHFEIEVQFESGRIVAGNGFFRIENGQKSPHYQNFISLSEPQIHQDTTPVISKNPFIRLYTDVIEGIYNPEWFRESIENILILTKSS